MEWRSYYLDMILVPLGLLMGVAYHCWLWHKVRTDPFTTIIGTNCSRHRLWLYAIMKENEKNSMLAVQTLWNTVMESILMATTSIMLIVGLAAVISSTYSARKALDASFLGGGHGGFILPLKFAMILCFLVFSFFCHSLSISFLNHVSFLVNTTPPPPQQHLATSSSSTMSDYDYVAEILQKGLVFNTLGNRFFYATLPLLLWIFGPLLLFLCCSIMIPLLYNHDFLFQSNGNQWISSQVSKSRSVPETVNRD